MSEPAAMHGAAAGRRGNWVAQAAAVLLVGCVFGVVSAVVTVRRIGDAGSVRVGAWSTPLDAGSAARGPYLRAAVALGATLALSRQETIYFFASTDDAGKTLDPACSYTIDGNDLPARWWSITLYDAKHYLIDTKQNRWSYASANVAHDTGEHFTITISRKPSPGNWLDPADAPGMVLVARLYQPHDDAARAPGSIAMPAIRKGDCT